MTTFTNETTFVVKTCCTCGVQFGMESAMNRRLIETRESFCCPAGHAQHYTAETEAEKLRKELERTRNSLLNRGALIDQLKSSLQDERKRRSAQKAVVTRMRNRAAKGVCPCCNRYFNDLHRHMSTKHPDYSSAPTE